MSDATLFNKIFAQRNASDDSLLKAAQAAALVYSFSAESGRHESQRLATLCNMMENDFTRRIAQLVDRGVAQCRGNWRAILPHAIANRLAVEALASWSPQVIEVALLDPAHPRMMVSFTKRIGFLHKSDRAVGLVKSWLAQDGILGMPEAFDSVRASIFFNVAPVCPWQALLALEGVGCRMAEPLAAEVWTKHSELLRLLAYEADLFTQSARMLASAALLCHDTIQRAASAKTLTSLFYASLSGTHAPVEQRMACLQAVAATEQAGAEELALACLDAALECEHITSSLHFAFGARSRDYGYHPESHEEVLVWFKAVLAKAIQLSVRTEWKVAMRSIIARRLPALWCIEGLEGDISALATALAKGTYWAEGWRACRRALARRSERLRPASRKQLSALEKALAPKSLNERVQAFLVGDYFLDLLDEAKEENGFQQAEQRLNRAAVELGKGLARDVVALRDLLATLLRTGLRTLEIGRSMARECADAEALWDLTLEGLALVPEKERNFSLPMGMLRGISETSRSQAEEILDQCVDMT